MYHLRTDPNFYYIRQTVKVLGCAIWNSYEGFPLMQSLVGSTNSHHASIEAQTK